MSVSHAPRKSWIALTVLLAGLTIALLDATIVNVALPSIRDSLNASESTLSWIISGYALSFGIALIPAGRIGDQHGHKWVFIFGVALFTAASVACGMAADDTQIIVWRVVQGLAGGIFAPAVGSFIQLLFVGRQRGRAFAILGSVIGFSSAIGLITGGLIIQAFGSAEGWRWIFYVNLPIGIATVIAAIFILPGHEAGLEKHTGLDWFGLVLLGGGLTAILVPLIEGQQQNWPIWTWLTMAVGVIGIALFALWQVYTDRRQKTPLVPPRLYKHASFVFGTILALVYFAGFVSIFFTLSILWQAGLGHTPLEAGFVSLPFAIGTIVGSSQSSRVAARIGRTTLLIGAAAMSVGLITVWLIFSNVAGADLTIWMLVAPLFVSGVGNGFFLAPNIQFIVASVDRSDAGAASGVVNTMQRVGTAIGVAVIGSILFGSLSITGKPPTPADIANAFGHSASLAMGMSALLTVIAFALVFTLPRKTAPLNGAAPVIAE
jgi:EmrB/QacA subfamily drug resistance transporter